MHVLREVSWDWVKAFVVVVEQGSLARAALQLGITGATLSRQMSALEARLGYHLFLRTRSGMAPTPEAQALLEPAQHMLDAMHRFGLSHARSDTGVQGVVGISAPETFALNVLPALLASLRALHPQIQLDVWALDAVSNLHQREADIAIRMLRPTQAGLIAKRVAQFSVGLYASQSYIARRGQPTRQNLAQHDWIDVLPQETMRQGLIKMGHPEAAQRIMLRANSHAGSWQLACAGLGIGHSLQVVGARAAQMVPVLPQVALPVYPVWLVAHQALREQARVRVVYDFLAQALKGLAV